MNEDRGPRAKAILHLKRSNFRKHGAMPLKYQRRISPLLEKKLYAIFTLMFSLKDINFLITRVGKSPRTETHKY